MFFIVGYRDIKIKEWIPSTKEEDPFMNTQLQKNPHGISDFKPVNQWRFFSVFWIPILPLYCVQSFWKDQDSTFYERTTIGFKIFLNRGLLFLLILILFFLLFPGFIMMFFS